MISVNETISPSVNNAGTPFAMGARSTSIVTAGRSASCTTTSAAPGSPTV